LNFQRAVNHQRELRAVIEINCARGGLVVLLLAALSLQTPMMPAQDVSAERGTQIDGVVHDSSGNVIAGASVRLLDEGRSYSAETKTNADGIFEFPAAPAGAYSVRIAKAGFRDTLEESIKLAPAEKKHCEFILRAAAERSAVSMASIELDDRPNFTVAGVTDSSAGGGHGSETRMRTGEALAKEALNLKAAKGNEGSATSSDKRVDRGMHVSESELRTALAKNPRNYDANHALGEFNFQSGKYCEAIPLLEAAYEINSRERSNAFDLARALDSCEKVAQAREQVSRILANEQNLSQPEEAELRRTLGDLDEKLDNPLEAVREYERAAGLEASEQNYFAWGVELLLHKAAAPAIDVFERGARSHPTSARMLAGLGAALYTSGSAEEAAQRLCEASDLEPANPAPYLFLGRIQDATSTSLPCAEQKQARFVQNQPENALANYYYAVALWKNNRGAGNSVALARSEMFLQKACAIDPKLDLAYLQLGNVYFARSAFPDALAAYQKAAEANPLNVDAHYRLGLTLKRLGEEAKAQHEFEEYKKLSQTETAAIEHQRRELRQFLFVLKDASKVPTSN
jgi:tetratricopeptide (TPR) repeat protein